MKAKRKGNGNVIYIICTTLLVYMICCWIDVAIHNGNEIPQYGKWNFFTWITETETDSCTVVSCVKANGNYRVTIEDSKGNLWAYYDSEYVTTGTEIVPVWNGNEIIGIEMKGEN